MIKKIHVAKNKEIKTINEAIKVAKGKTIIILDDEYYFEKVVINKENIIIDGKNKAHIVYNDYALKKDELNRDYITFRTYTVLVKSKNVILKNLFIENNAGYGDNIGQAVALSLYNTNIKVKNCTLKANQDTLFCGPLSKDLEERYVDILPLEERISNVEFKHYFIKDTIIGNVDFIFGGSSAVFNKCTIISLPSKGNNSWIVAPNHNKENNHGFIFKNCFLLKNNDVKDETVFLARPWREYGFVTFKHCYLGSHINKLGFDKWDNTNRHETARFIEINSYGPGANKIDRALWSKIK